MATTSQEKRRARKGTSETDIGATLVEGVPKFKQAPDARAGVTAVLYGGEHYKDFTHLYRDVPEAKEHRHGKVKSGKRGTVGDTRSKLWPEMQVPGTSGTGLDEDDEPAEVPATGADDTGEGEGGEGGEPVVEEEGYTLADLEQTTDEDLKAIAEAKGITVKPKRGRKRATRQQYLDALVGQ